MHEKQQWTSGPWGIYKDEALDEYEIRLLVECSPDVWNWEKIAGDVSKQNANLISAAPDLYKALEQYEVIARKGMNRTTATEWDEAFETAQAAMDKALGSRGEPGSEVSK